MALQESHESHSTLHSIYGSVYGCQTWTTESAYTIESVALYGYRQGSPGDVVVEIFAVDGLGKPTGSALATCTEDGSNLSTSQEWYTFVFDTPYALADDTQYAIVVSSAGANSSNDYNWRYNASNSYAGGQRFFSSNAGSWWSAADADCTFRTYSEEPEVTELAGTSSITFGSTSNLTGTTLDIAGTAEITFGSSANLEGYLGLSGTTGIVFGNSNPDIFNYVDISGTSGITFGGSGTVSFFIGIGGTAGITFGGTGLLNASLTLGGTAGITFGISSAIVIFGPPSGDKIEKYGRTLVLIGNDCVYYES